MRRMFACALVAALSIDPPAAAAQDAPVVKLEKHFLVASPRGPVRSVAFDYDFPGRARVDIRGLGTVPARGAFSFLTADDALEFREPGTGRVLLSLALKNPTKLMGRYSVALPALTDFPPAFRSGRWRRQGSFQVHLSEVLNREFPSGFMVLQVERSNAVLTTYRDLDGVREPLYGRVAVMVEPPPDGSSGAPFRLRFASQERRSHTDWQALGSREVQEAVARYVSSLLHELEGAAP